MLSINEKKFMNISEAVQWLLNNNALPFQSTANYVADTVIAKTSIINPSPAEIRIGSLVLFADGKVGTVSGITANGFMVGAESTDLSDGVPHITNISIDAHSHLIITMSEGDPIDAGLIKEVSSMSIDASQHLIVHYNDGTTNDLGAIFSGNITISGNLTVSGSASLPTITSPNETISAQKPVVEVMSGYSAAITSQLDTWDKDICYVGVAKNANKLTFVGCLKVTKRSTTTENTPDLIEFVLPASIGAKLIPTNIGGFSYLDQKALPCFSSAGQYVLCPFRISKYGDTIIRMVGDLTDLVVDTEYLIRYEATFLLSDSLI